MKKKKKKPRVLRTPVSTKKQLSPISFNLGLMVKQYIIAKILVGSLEAKKMWGEAQFFSGVIRGYDDWFDCLKINQDVFDTVASRLDRGDIRKEADRLLEQICKTSSSVIPGIDYKEIVALKTDFDRKIKK